MKQLIFSAFLVSILTLAYSQQSGYVYPSNLNRWTGTVDLLNPIDNEIRAGIDSLNGFRGWAKFDISSIPPSATILQVNLNFYVDTPSGNPSSHELAISKLVSDPVTSPRNTIWNEIGSLPNYTTCVLCGDITGAKTLTSITSMVNDVQTSLAQGWFSIGFFDQSDDGAYCNIEGRTSIRKPSLFIYFDLPAVANVSASKGTDCENVAITWTSSTVGFIYHVYRGSTFLGWTSDSFYNDSSGTTLSETYKVYAAYQAGGSGHSSNYGSDNGYKLSCIAPNLNVPNNSGTDSVTLSSTSSGGSCGPIAFKWYNGAYCSGAVLGTTDTLTVTSSGNYGCKAYIVGYEFECSTCDVGYAEVILCTSPAANVPNNSGIDSVTMTCTTTGGWGGGIGYKWYSGASCSGTVLGTDSTLNVTATGNYSAKGYIVGFESSCYDCNTGYATVTTCTSPTASVLNSSGIGTATLTCTATGGSGGAIAYKWYKGTTCAGLVVGTGSSIVVAMSGNYICKAYITGNESVCWVSDIGYADVVSCTNPVSSVSGNSGIGSATLTCTSSGGSGGTIAYKWYSGTSCIGSVLGTSSVLNVTSSGNYSCKSYITGHESACYECDADQVIVSGCTSPNANIARVTALDSATLVCSTSGGSGGSIGYEWYKGSTCTGPIIGTNSTLTVDSSWNYACKAYIIGFDSTCYTCEVGKATVNYCTSPLVTILDNEDIDSVSLTSQASAGYGGPYGYKWYASKYCSGSVIGRDSTVYVHASGDYACKTYIVGHESKCFTCVYAYAKRNPPIGIASHESLRDISIYPNPTTGQLNIEIKDMAGKKLDITLINLVGQVAYQKKVISLSGSDQFILDLSSYVRGIYHLQVKTKEGTLHQKIVVN